MGKRFLNIALEPIVVAGLYALLFYPPYLRGLFFEPEYLPTIALVGVLFAVLVLDRLNRGETGVLEQPLDYFALAFPVAYAIPFILGPADYHGASREFLKAAMYFAVYWMFSRTFSTEKGLKRALQVLLAAATGVSAIGLAAAAGVFRYPGAVVGKEILSTFQYPNALAAYLMVANLVGVVLWALAESRLGRLLLAGANLAVFLVILGTGSRGVWVVLPFAFLVLLIGLPRPLVSTVLYNQVLVMGLGLFLSRPFYARLYGNQDRAALGVLLAGIGLVFLGEVVREAFATYMGRKQLDPNVRRVLTVTGVLYLLLIGVVYVAYTAQVLPVFYERLVTPEMARKIQDIRVETPSFAARMLYNRDALRMALDHPLVGAGGGAWNALYHMYQPVMYWTTEVHNHFLQVLVETGIVGLSAFLGVWFLVLRALYRAWRWVRGAEAGLPPWGTPAELTGGWRAWSLLWATGLAMLALGAHAVFDFDLSLPSLGIILWAAFGMVAGVGGNRFRTVSERSVKYIKPGRVPPWAIPVGAVAGAVILVTLAVRFDLAGHRGAEAARVMAAGHSGQARPLAATAVRLDPWTASYRFDLAQIQGALGRGQGGEEFLESAVALADRAARLEPHSVPLYMRLPGLYVALGEYTTAAQAARQLTRTLPLVVSSWETWGETLILAAMDALDHNETEKARSYLEEMEGIPGQMEEAGDPADPWARRAGIAARPLAATEGINLVLGQAAYLEGNAPLAATRLEPLLKSKRSNEAKLWLAAAWAQVGRHREASELVSPLLDEQPRLQREYRKITALGKKLAGTRQP